MNMSLILQVQFCENVYSLALSLDCSPSSHSVEVDVQHPDEVNEIFDTISYAKGLLIDPITPANVVLNFQIL